MKSRIAILICIAAVCGAQTYEPRSLDTLRAAPALEAMAGNSKGWQWTLTADGTAFNLTNCTPAMWWAPDNQANVATAACSVVSATGGTFRALFAPTALQPTGYTSNDVAGDYGVGVYAADGSYSTLRKGRITVRPDPFAAGAAAASWAVGVTVTADDLANLRALQTWYDASAAGLATAASLTTASNALQAQITANMTNTLMATADGSGNGLTVVTLAGAGNWGFGTDGTNGWFYLGNARGILDEPGAYKLWDSNNHTNN